MPYIILYCATATVFLVLDAIVLTTVMKPLFQHHLGDALLDEIRLVPAALFYLFYVGVLVWLVTAAALASGPSWSVALNAALFGAAAYGTYEFTNLSTLRDWSWQMVAVDLTWGTVLTTVSALTGLWITRSVT